MKLIALGVCAAVLAGCTKTVEEMTFTEREQLRVAIEKSCVEQGTVPGTQRYGNCLVAEANREIYTRRRDNHRRHEAAEAIGAGMQNVSQGYYNAAASGSSGTTTCTRVPSPAGYAKVRCY